MYSEQHLLPLPELTSEDAFVYEKRAQFRRTRRQPVVLVVEDQPFSRKLLFGVVQGISEVHMADNAYQGWELFLSICPDIVFLDIELEGVDGHILAWQIRKLDADVFVAMVTANRSESDVLRAQTNRVDAFIVKPYSKQKILQCFERYVGMRTEGYVSMS